MSLLHTRRNDPWSLHRNLLNEVNRLLEGSTDASSAATADWIPSVDIDEYDDRFVLRADMPGIDPSSIDITLEKGVLTLSGNREAAATEEGAEPRRRERSAGSFMRRFVLPDTVDAEAVSATSKHGVLEVVIPKRAQAQARKIAISH